MPVCLSDLINHLVDLSRAGEQRCAEAAALTGTPRVQAELVLRAAQHQSDSVSLHAVVVELRGIPHGGATDGVLADPVWQSAPAATRDEHALLEACLQVEDAIIEACKQVLRLDGLPPSVSGPVKHCLDTATDHQRALQAMQAR